MRYCLNLSRIGLLEYRDLLKAQNLLPGRRMLLDDIDRLLETARPLQDTPLKECA